MRRLLSVYFEGVVAEQFEADLADKNWVVLLQDEGGTLLGFSTLRYYQTHYEGRPLGVVYSGDTIADQSAWRSTALLQCWIESVNHLHRAAAREPLYWLLIVSGFRTYRMLPAFWRVFHPCHDGTAPRGHRALMDYLAAGRFGDRYDAATGIVRLPRPQVLRQEFREIPESRRKDPHVSYFAEANPGYVRGDELLCLTELSTANLTPVGARVARGGAPQALAGA
jgi:hypothetical protein